MRDINARRRRMTGARPDVISGAEVALHHAEERFEVGPVSNCAHVHLSLGAHKLLSGTTVEANYDDGRGKVAFWLAIITGIYGYFVSLQWLGDKSGLTLWRNFGTYDPPPRGEADNRIFYVGYANNERQVYRAPPHIPVPEIGWPACIEEHFLHANALVDDIHNIAREENEGFLRKGPDVDDFVEIDDIANIKAVRPATVEENKGGRLKLRYIDVRPDQGFRSEIFVHGSSPRMLPRGMARILGRRLTSTERYFIDSVHDLIRDPLDPYVRKFEPRKVPNFLERVFENFRFEVGAKLEVLDPLLPGSICVGSIVRVLGNLWLEIKIEDAELEDGSDHIVCFHASDYELLPAGWAIENGLEDFFRPPRNFSWEEEPSKVPRELLQRHIPTHAFRRGQRYEAVGVAGTDLIYLVEVKAVKEPLVLMHFVGYGAEEDAFMPITSLDIFPLGWCDSVRHPLRAVLA